MKRIRLLNLLILVMIITSSNTPLFGLVKKVEAVSDTEWLATIGYPFEQGNTWCVAQGYNTTHTHGGYQNQRFALDLAVNFPNPDDGSDSIGKNIIAAADGYIRDYYHADGFAVRVFKDNQKSGYAAEYAHIDLDVNSMHPAVKNAYQSGTMGGFIKKGEVIGKVFDDYAPGDHIYHQHFQLTYFGYNPTTNKNEYSPIELKYGVWDLPFDDITQNMYLYNCFNSQETNIKLNNPANNLEIPYTSDSIQLNWQPLTQYQNVTYDVYVNNAKVTTTTSTSYTINDLAYRPISQPITWKIISNIDNPEEGAIGNIQSEQRTFTRIIPKANFTNPASNKFYRDRNINVEVGDVTNQDSEYTSTKYQIQISTQNNFADNIYNQIGTALRNIQFPNGGKFFMRSRASYEVAGITTYYGAWSDTREIVIAHPDINIYSFTPTSGANANKEMLFQTMLGDDSNGIDNKYKFRMRYSLDGEFNGGTGETWSSYNTPETYSNVHMAVFNSKLYQLVRLKNSPNTVQTRFTSDGILWYSWTSDINTVSGFTLSGDVTMITHKVNSVERLYQFTRSTLGNIYFRYTVDGVFNESVPSEKWTQQNGMTDGSIMVNIHNNKLYQTIKGYQTGNIFMRIIDESGNVIPQNNSEWKDVGTLTTGDISTFSFKGRLYQAIRGAALNGEIYYRSTADEIFNFAEPSSGWTLDNGRTFSDISTTIFKDKIYQSLRGSDNIGNPYIRSSSDGEFDGFDKSMSNEQLALEDWTIQDSGRGKSEIESISFNGKMYQVIRGHDDRLYVRSSSTYDFNNSNDATDWILLENSLTKGEVSLMTFLDKIYITTIGRDDHIIRIGIINPSTNTLEGSWTLSGGGVSPLGNPELFIYKGFLFQSFTINGLLYMRYSQDGVFDGSVSSENWVSSIAAKGDITFINFSGTLVMTVTGTDNIAKTRSTTDGTNWSNWFSSGYSYSNISFGKDTMTLYQSVVGTPTGLVYTRQGYLTNQTSPQTTEQGGGLYWTPWVSSGSTPYKISNSKSTLLENQAVLGPDYFVYTRYANTQGNYANGNYTWANPWKKEIHGETNITFSNHNGAMCMSVVGSAINLRNIWMKCTTDGIFDGLDNRVAFPVDTKENWITN